MPDTELRYGATAICVRASYAIPGTQLRKGATRQGGPGLPDLISLPQRERDLLQVQTPCPCKRLVLTWRITVRRPRLLPTRPVQSARYSGRVCWRSEATLSAGKPGLANIQISEARDLFEARAVLLTPTC
eukprot:1430877-Rhodomonas_salina.1